MDWLFLWDGRGCRESFALLNSVTPDNFSDLYLNSETIMKTVENIAEMVKDFTKVTDNILKTVQTICELFKM